MVRDFAGIWRSAGKIVYSTPDIPATEAERAYYRQEHGSRKGSGKSRERPHPAAP